MVKTRQNTVYIYVASAYLFFSERPTGASAVQCGRVGPPKVHPSMQRTRRFAIAHCAWSAASSERFGARVVVHRAHRHLLKKIAMAGGSSGAPGHLARDFVWYG